MTASPPGANQPHPDHLPTPFSAAEIRSACGLGRVNVYLMSQPGSDPHLTLTRFVAGDDTAATFERKATNLEGSRISEIEVEQSEWTALQAHGSYPADSTALARDTVVTDAGTFDCWRYTHRDAAEGRQVVTRAWFALDLPGPPVKMTREADGETVFEMTLVEVNDPRM